MTADRSKIFSLTDAQLPIWLDHAFYPRTPIYNTGQTLTLQISLELNRFVEALNLVVAENDALRLRFVQADNEVAQEVVDDVPVDLQYKDLSGDKDPESAAKAWIEAIFWKPIGTEDFPLFGFAVAKLARDRFIWLQKYHHLIIDAAGRQLVCARTAAIYDSLTATGPPCEFNLKSFAKFIDSQTHCRDSESWAVDEAYWRTRLGNVACPLVHSDPRLGEKSRSGRPVRLACNLSIQSSDALRSFARQQSSTVFKVFLALAWCCFRRIYGSADVIFGVPLASRRSDAVRDTIGLFAKIMPFRVQLDEATTLAAALSAINCAFSEDLEHQRFPNHRINRLIRSKGHNVSTVYDVILNYQRIDYGFSFGGAPVTCSNIAVGFSVPWEITTFEHGPDAPLEIALDYDPGRIESEEALRFFQCFQELLQRAPQCAEIALGRLPVVSAQQRATLLRRGRGERVAVLKSATLAALFADQVRRSPDATALICGHQRLTYAQLDAQAAQLARRLISLGVGPDTLVGICLRRTTLLIVAILAIHKAGGAYLPLDPGYPRERLAFMIEDANVKLILTQKEQIRLLDTRNAHLISLDELSSLSASKASRGDPESRVNSDNLAYVLYTSGSTGKPKGVAVKHRSAVNLVLASRNRLGEKDVAGILFSTSVNFDISVYEIFLPLACGGAIILVDNLFALAIATAKDEVRLINTVPSLMSAFLAESGLPDGIRVINLIGEALPRTLADRLLAERSDLRLFNLYGPTETTVYSTASLVDAKDRRSPPIGVPIWNTEAYVLDEFLELLPDGAVGELWIGGAGVAKGYLGRPELTDQRFVPSPFGEGRIYKTGDLVRWLPNGELEFCGRADQQVKINGVRIELGEVEQRLQVHPAVSEAVVTAVEDDRGRKSLVAHLVSKRAGGRPSDTVIRKHLAKFLPSHSMPASLVWLNELPLTPNGKLDRRALPAPRYDANLAGTYVAPRDALEEAVAGVWRDVLKLEQVGVHDNFFELGGHSLSALHVISKINRRLRVSVSVLELFKNPTVAQMRRLILSQQPSNKRRPTVVVLQDGQSQLPVYFIYAGTHELGLARLMGSNHQVFGIDVPWPLEWRRAAAANRTSDFPSMEQLVAPYVSALSSHAGSSPCVLAGYSFAGLMAFEAAHQFQRQGGKVAMVVLFDSWGKRPNQLLTVWNKVRRAWQTANVPPTCLHSRLMDYRYRLKGLSRWFWSRLQRRALSFFNRAEPNPPKLTGLLDEQSSFLEWEVMERLYGGMAKFYRPRRLAGRGILIRADPIEGIEAAGTTDGTRGWKNLFTEGLEIIPAVGDHHSIVHKHDPMLIRKINDLLKPH